MRTTNPARRQAPAGARRGGAFTLIELLVVVAIVMVLAALVLPAARKSLDLAHRARCLSNLRQAGYAATLYANDHEDRKPPIEGPHAWTTPNVKWNHRFVGMGILVDTYLDVHDMVLCPAIEPSMDIGNDKEMWLTSPYVGSSYFYEWHHPFPTQTLYMPTNLTPEEQARFRETSHLSTAPNHAMLMDMNFEWWYQYQGPVRSHRRLGTANVLFADASAGTFKQHENGLIVTRSDKPYRIWLAWEAAHQLRP